MKTTKNLSLIVISFISISSFPIGGCSGEGSTTNATPSVELSGNATCVPNEPRPCVCQNGSQGTAYCAEDGKSYSSCGCPNIPTADAGYEASSQKDASPDTTVETDAEVEASIDAKIDVLEEAGDDAEADANLDADIDADLDATIDVNTQTDKLAVYANGHPAPNIVIAGKDAWIPFSRYKACAKGEDIRIKLITAQALNVTNQSVAQSLTDYGIAIGGTLQPSTIISNISDGFIDMDLGNGFLVQDKSCVAFEIWAKTADTKPSSECSYWNSCTYSGKAFKIRIGHSHTWYWQDAGISDEWNNNLFIHAFSESSSQQIYAKKGTADPNFMTIRKSKPIITPRAISNTTLGSGQRELSRFHIGSDTAGEVAIKQILFVIQKNSNVQLHDLRFFRGNTPLPMQEYTVINAATGEDLYNGTVNDDFNIIAVSFTGEETITNSGNIYSLKATAGYVSTNNFVTVKFFTNMPANTTPVTGWLINDDEYTPYGPYPQLFNVGDFTGCGQGNTCWHALGTFVWSDISEDPHTSEVYYSNGSRDWTTDQHIHDLTGSWTLSD
ncbi:hypothetical protein GF391_04525 [Candidatus Uhrbacteria bacterium]|nr:hypothetical protein [Candidatus Uhrbacteria bacterium]